MKKRWSFSLGMWVGSWWLVFEGRIKGGVGRRPVLAKLSVCMVLKPTRLLTV
jgi:hypothetical protein